MKDHFWKPFKTKGERTFLKHSTKRKGGIGKGDNQSGESEKRDANTGKEKKSGREYVARE